MKIILNHKSNLTYQEIVNYYKEYKELDTKHDLIVCPTTCYLPIFKDVVLGSQDISPYKMGSYTGEVSGEALKSLGVKYVFINHSERRHLNNEPLELAKEKLIRAKEADLIPILCVGEEDGEDAVEVLTHDLNYLLKDLNIDNLYISQPDSGEQALEICETMVRSGAIDIVIVDSVAALVPKAEIDGDMGDSHVGLQARLMSQALRKLTPVVSKNNCVVIFINQLREKVGVMFGNPETTTGGRALKFYASVRLDVRKIETLKSGGEVIGNRTRVKIVKNKVAPPFREAEFDIMFGKGISTEGDLIDLASNVGIVQKSGAWFSYNGEKIGQGRENAKQFLLNNPELKDEIDKKVRAHYGIGEEADTAEAEDAKAKSKKKTGEKEAEEVNV